MPILTLEKIKTPGGWTREQHSPEGILGLFELTIWLPHTLKYGPEVEHGPGGRVDLTPMRTWLEEMLRLTVGSSKGDVIIQIITKE